MNNKSENLVIWEKWRDPFGSDDEIIQNILSENEEETEDENQIPETADNQNPQNIRVMATPMGIIPVTENTASGKIFNFWTGHTNFNITRRIASIIEETEGVETLDIFTRYRFRISVGKAFDDSSIMRSINDNVYSYLE